MIHPKQMLSFCLKILLAAAGARCEAAQQSLSVSKILPAAQVPGASMPLAPAAAGDERSSLGADFDLRPSASYSPILEASESPAPHPAIAPENPASSAQSTAQGDRESPGSVSAVEPADSAPVRQERAEALARFGNAIETRIPGGVIQPDHNGEKAADLFSQRDALENLFDHASAPAGNGSGLTSPAPVSEADAKLAALMAENHLTLRAAKNSDKARVLAFIQRIRMEYGVVAPLPDAPGSFDSDLLDIEGHYDEFVISENARGEIVATAGFGKVAEGIAEGKKGYFDAKIRGKKMAKYMLLSFLNHAKARGYRRFQMETYTNMTEAIGLYRHLGFTQYVPANPEADSAYFYKDL